MYSKEMIEYFSAPGLNSTLLGAFANDPLYAVQKSAPKSYFESGKAFERTFEDRIMKTNRFGERFFICEDIKIPDSFIDVYKSKEPLESHFKYTKKGEFNKTKASTHEVIFQCLLDRDHFSGIKRYPIPLSEYQSMELCVDRLLNMSIELFEGEEFLLRDLIDENTLFQYPAYWISGGIKKKALYDMVVFFERHGRGWCLPIDLKYMANLKSMNSFFRNTKDKYTLQSMHYAEGLEYIEELEGFIKYPQMPFCVATRQDPYFVQPFIMDEQSIEYAYDDYYAVCSECEKWIQDGKKTTGIKKTKHQKIWRN